MVNCVLFIFIGKRFYKKYKKCIKKMLKLKHILNKVRKINIFVHIFGLRDVIIRLVKKPPNIFSLTLSAT